ncbi:hypothetical protein LSM04_008979 [Trypanosoma melophagium]|uniref:uncharacterized protein n=1 Tax=Trypanosoma melophagium TaxID=715481 RepID=UPI00351A94BC|nr:hypothetical protein LSM04_008979 [Trypanosoma melophagium]
MPLVLRLCLHTVGSNGSKTQVWLSFSVLQSTTPRDIITQARRSVVERMGAALEVSKSYETELALCVRDASDRFLFLGIAAMEAAGQTPLMKMAFVQELRRQKQERRLTSTDITETAWEHFLFLQGALVPLGDLKRLIGRGSSAEMKDFTMLEVVEVPAELSGDPITVDASLRQKRRGTDVESKLKRSINSISGNDFANHINRFTAFSDCTSFPLPPLGASTGGNKTNANTVHVVYVDFAGRQYTTTVPQKDSQSLSSLIRTACTDIGFQVGCAFQPSKMRLICYLGNSTTHTLENDAALHAALKDEHARFFLAPDSRFLESPLAPNPENSLSAPSLMLKESQEAYNVLRNGPISVLSPITPTDSVTPAVTAPVAVSAPADVVSSEDTINAKSNLPWTLATTAVTLRQLASLHPTPSFSARDRESMLRRSSSSNTSATKNMSEEEDNARLRLAAAHFRMDELCRQYVATSRESESDSVYNELCKKKAVLIEEWTECVSAERDCERLDLLLAWLERDVADGHTRQENLIRTLYAAH